MTRQVLSVLKKKKTENNSVWSTLAIFRNIQRGHTLLSVGQLQSCENMCWVFPDLLISSRIYKSKYFM